MCFPEDPPVTSDPVTPNSLDHQQSCPPPLTPPTSCYRIPLALPGPCWKPSRIFATISLRAFNLTALYQRGLPQPLPQLYPSTFYPFPVHSSSLHIGYQLQTVLLVS